ncbi:RNA-binding protein, putative [Plasmodium relictum]|uniref:RNA-binding protein, putative n=1 Tax=Plasmodium relictum TaxID=85471 RepID=A0A1J1H3H1_PLARL|nr:RNA-binding protein, putative [Plasmodium relictum]CRG99104.1 RNA-binding protein, putative [Plasmodium relictum]
MFFHMLKVEKVIPKKDFKKNTLISFINNDKFFKIVRSFTEYHTEEKINLPRLKLRGLPFNASEEEIKNFFKNFQLSKKNYPIHIIKGVKNKPTGHAYVYFDDEEEARNACKTLNRKFLRDRYVEIYIDYVFNHNLTPTKDHVTTLMRDRYKKDNQ